MQSLNHPKTSHHPFVRSTSVAAPHRNQQRNAPSANGITYMKQLQFYLFIHPVMNNVLNSSTASGGFVVVVVIVLGSRLARCVDSTPRCCCCHMVSHALSITVSRLITRHHRVRTTHKCGWLFPCLSPVPVPISRTQLQQMGGGCRMCF